MLYLFWCDELIRTIFDVLAYIFQPEHIKDKKQFGQNLRARFFLLGIYFVFIIVVFGLMMEFNNENLLQLNFEVFFFKNLWFNLTITNIVGRELYEFFSNDSSQIHSHTALSPGMIVLHISIIFGAFAYLFVAIKLPEAWNSIGNLRSLLAALPFLLLKLFFEWKGLTKFE